MSHSSKPLDQTLERIRLAATAEARQQHSEAFCTAAAAAITGQLPPGALPGTATLHLAGVTLIVKRESDGRIVWSCRQLGRELPPSGDDSLEHWAIDNAVRAFLSMLTSTH